MRFTKVTILLFFFTFNHIFADNTSIKLDIYTVIERAETYSKQMRMSEQNIIEAEAKKSQTFASMLPTLSLDSTQAWISNDVNKLAGTSMGTTKIPDRINTISLTLAQPIVPLFPLYIKLQTDITAIKVAKANHEQNKIIAKFYAAEAYIRAQKAKEFINIAKAGLSVVQKQKQDADFIFKAGKINNFDLLRLDIALSEANLQVAQAKNIYELSLFALAETINIKEYKNILLAEQEKAIFENTSLKLPEQNEALTDAENNRAELKTMDSVVEMVDKMYLASKADWAPMINAFIKYERDFTKEDITINPTHYGHNPRANNAPLYSPATTINKNDIRDNLTFGFTFKWLIWDSFSRLNKIEELDANLNRAIIQKELAYSGIKLEVTQALLEVQNAQNTLESAKITLKFAEEAYKQQNIRFKNGLLTTTDIITAQRDQIRAQGSLINGRGDLDIAWLKLFKTIGKTLPLNKQKESL